MLYVYVWPLYCSFKLALLTVDACEMIQGFGSLPHVAIFQIYTRNSLFVLLCVRKAQQK